MQSTTWFLTIAYGTAMKKTPLLVLCVMASGGFFKDKQRFRGEKIVPSIDTCSNLNSGRSIFTTRLGNYQEVVGLLMHMFRAATTMSLSQVWDKTPYKGSCSEGSFSSFLLLRLEPWQLKI
jgi:hypothetical protein